MPKRMLKKLTQPIVAIYNNIMCGVKLLINAPKCMIYYILDMIGYVLYLPLMIFFWMFGLRSIERQLFKGINQVDSAIYGVADFHVFKYPNSIMNKCYRCKDKKEKKGENWLDKYLAETEDPDRKVTFFEVMLFIIITSFLFYCGYYYFNIKK